MLKYSYVAWVSHDFMLFYSLTFTDKEPTNHSEAVGLATHPGVTTFTKENFKDEFIGRATEGHSNVSAN
jgi:hypothetical protein